MKSNFILEDKELTSVESSTILPEGMVIEIDEDLYVIEGSLGKISKPAPLSNLRLEINYYVKPLKKADNGLVQGN